MVGLHVLNHKVVGLASAQRVLKIVKPLVGKGGIHRVHNGDLLVRDQIGIIRHAVRHYVLTLKEINGMIVHTNVSDVFCYVHFYILRILF